MTVAELRASGALALTVDRRDGGGGGGPEAAADLIMGLAAIDGSLGQIPQSHFAFLEFIRIAGTTAQWRRWGARVAAGAFLANAQAERGLPAGAPPAVTLARGPDGGWRLDGDKHFCTGSAYATHLAVTATVPGAGTRVALVRADAPGVDVVDDWDGLGQRATASGTVRFRGAEVDPEDIIDRTPVAAAPTGYGAYAQLLHAAIDAGLARGAVDEAVGGLRGPDGSGPAQRDPSLSHRLGELEIAAFAARAAVRDAAAAVAGGGAGAAAAVAAARHIAADAALETTAAVLEVLGARAATASAGHDERWRDARTHTLHDPVRRKAALIGDWRLHGDVPRPGVFS